MTSGPEPERLDSSALRERQLLRLQSLLAEVGRSNRFWAEKFRAAGVDPAAEVRSLDDLSRLPVTTKSELVDDQAAHPPYGTNLTNPLTDYTRLHQTSGTTGAPLRWLDTPASWSWLMDCWAQIYRLIGLRSDDRLAFPFSFGPFIGFWAGFEGAQQAGAFCLSGGGMSSQARLRLIEENRATIVCCTPTYALRLAEVAASEGIAIRDGSVRGLLVAGEPGGSIAATRNRIESAWRARVFDHWGMTEIGALAVECEQCPAGLHVLETECIAEIVDPSSLQPVPPGTIGELIITNLGRVGSPLVRYRTGDLVEADSAPCRCGRSLLRLKGGILGRSDDMVTIRGNNVFPSSIEAVIREFDAIAEFRIVVQSRRSMEHLRIEIEPAETPAIGQDADRLAEHVIEAIRNRFHFQAEVVVVPAGTLPRFELKGRRFFREST